MQNSKKFWLKGGLSLAIISLVAALFWYFSVPPVTYDSQLAENSNFDLLIYLGLWTLYGFILGAIFGKLFEMIKGRAR